MPLEIERKFLVKNDGWKTHVIGQARLRDGLVERSGRAKVRIRIADDGSATIALKTHRSGGVRSEYEYPIPLQDAEEILASMCDHVLVKTRYFVPEGTHQWVVDVYDGLLDGVVLAEIELSAPDETFPIPEWVGSEVTFDRSYQKINMVLARQGRN